MKTMYCGTGDDIFTRLPTDSKLCITFSDGYTVHATYSHYAGDQAYGFFDGDEDMKQILQRASELNSETPWICPMYYDEDQDVEYDDEYVNFTILQLGTGKPQVYVEFELELIGAVLENHIEIWHDYMDQGFQTLQLEYKKEDFSDDGRGYAQFWKNESIWINKYDYNTLISTFRAYQ